MTGNPGPLNGLSATGTAAAVADAVYDAVGIGVRDLPITIEQLVGEGR